MIETAAIIQLMGTGGVGPRKLSRLLRRLQAEKVSVTDLVEMSDEELTADYKFCRGAIETMRSSRVLAEATARELEANGVRMVVLGREGYPRALMDSLGDDGAPPVMFVHGNMELLERPSVGFCGPRDVSEKGAAAVVELVAMACQKDLVVVSGFAGGVDLAAHVSCLQSGGATVAVLPTGILHFRPSGVFQELADESNSVVVSEFFPRAGWSVGFAMQRNRTVCGLSGAVVMIEPGETGGTFHAGKAALEVGRPLFLARPEPKEKPTRGEKYFLRRGVTPLVRERDIWSVGALFSAIDAEKQAPGGQESLF
jgi:DNA protecting protein DprA